MGTIAEDELFLRNKRDGTIYRWNRYQAANPMCEEVTGLQAFPEQFVNKKQVTKAKRSRARRKSTGLALETKEPDTTHVAPEISADASQGLATD